MSDIPDIDTNPILVLQRIVAQLPPPVVLRKGDRIVARPKTRAENPWILARPAKRPPIPRWPRGVPATMEDVRRIVLWMHSNGNVRYTKRRIRTHATAIAHIARWCIGKTYPCPGHLREKHRRRGWPTLNAWKIASPEVHAAIAKLALKCLKATW